MTSDVYFISVDNAKEELPKIVKKLIPYKKCCVKLHFGEKGNTTHLKPWIAETVCSRFDKADLIDCNVLYLGSRTKTKDHLETAKEHGFDFAPVVIADSKNEMEIPVNLHYFDSIKVGKAVDNYENMVALTHFKGHRAAGYGGAFKNVGMGLGSRAGKLEMHSKVSPSVDKDKCIGCGTCEKHCPANAITIENGKSHINHKKCIGCAECISICPQKAVNIPWDGTSAKELQERLVEYFYGIVKNKNMLYINVLMDITKKCDCESNPGKTLCNDIGILVSKDPVAIDKCSLDLVKEQGVDFGKIHNINPEHQLKHAEQLGLGTRKYKLKER